MDKLKRFLKTSLLGGVVVILPVAILAAVSVWLFNLVTGLIEPLTRLLIKDSQLNDYAAQRYGFEGVVITEVSRGSPADRAGLEPVRVDRRGRWSGDVIVGIDGRSVRNLAELQDAFEDAGGAGSGVTLTVFDGRSERKVEISLVEINR